MYQTQLCQDPGGVVELLSYQAAAVLRSLGGETQHFEWLIRGKLSQFSFLCCLS